MQLLCIEARLIVAQTPVCVHRTVSKAPTVKEGKGTMTECFLGGLTEPTIAG